MPKLIQRYAKQRLYDTQAMRYGTITDLRAWVANGIPFIVIDADTGDDVTRVLLG